MSIKTSISSLRKSLAKAKIPVGIFEPDSWLSTGIYKLNLDMTGTFHHAVPNRRSVYFYGQSGTGKSFIMSNLAKEAQDGGYFVIYIDTESAIHSKYLEKIGVSMDDDKFMVVNASTISHVTKIMSDVYNDFEKDDKVCVILDSVTNLETDTDAENFKKGVLKGDMGQKAKALKKMMTSINSKIGERDMFFIATAHAYLNQDMMNGMGKWIMSGGEGFQFLASINVLLTRLNLKDESKKIVGIKIKTEIIKSRFNQKGSKSEIELDYHKGFDSFAGLLELGVESGLITQSGAWYSYVDSNNEVVKFQRKTFADHFMNIFPITETKHLVPEEDGSYEIELAVKES